MKHYYKIVLTLTLSLFLGFSSWGQLTTGDIAFLGYNADAPDAFSIVALVDIPSSSIIYFTDNESDGAGGINSGEGTLSWNTGASVIAAGTVITFTDLNATRTASVGTLSIDNGTLNIAGGGDAIFAFIGTNGTTPTTFLAGIQNETGNFGNLAGTGLTEGTTFVNFFMSGSPDGGQYNGPRTGLGSFSDYLTEIGDNTNWTVSDADGTLILPLNATSFEVTPTWTGTTDNDWATATNWSTGTVPGASDNVIIPANLTNYPTVSSTTTVNTLQIASGATLIANAQVNGTATYTRNLPTTNWYLVSSPLSGESIDDVTANNDLASGTGGNLGLGFYLNNGATPWVYALVSSNRAIDEGEGMSIKLANPGNFVVSGNLNSSTLGFNISTGSRNNFNLVGNPYLSFINSATLASDNTSELTEETVWLWNGTEYVTYNAVSPIEIAPGQGFFIEASSTGSLVTFVNSNQSHQSTDTFLRQESHPSFELFVTNGNENTSTKVFYVNNKTTGFDNGYDSKMFGGIDKDFAIFTQLVSDDQGKKLAIQTLPNTDHATMIIPVGLTAKADQELTFSVSSTNLPSGIEIYLEDRVNNTFVNLSEGDHTIITKADINGIGQYYIHASSAKLSNEDITQNISNVSIYKSSENEITIAGLQASANVKVFSLLGEELIDTDINSNGISKVTLPNLSTGVYVVKLNSTLGNITKKIILE
ncbi:hypothetical protein BTO06_11580 [Tenacibaculum sp. SZ-18]|uniref:T9SS type A sorting domain-containing protein n=1 Tax=Tenacibaculum sp. SZ-18 TaxID=754423 RepID=UPI000C2D675A|nr:T9SS type A sorting domain-containing protein [Tenacibaculum sp. SZ-18]AUC15750.1 hypothetical protein BTO06_11580 [Tenacibaculum sp. SZ-18]